MTMVKSGERKLENAREIEVQGVVAVKVITLSELDDSIRAVEIEMRPDIEAFEIFECLP